MKLDSCGDKEWCLLLQTLGNLDFGYRIKEISNGYVLLTAYNSFDPNERVHMYKLNKSGEIIWKKLYASIIEHPDIRNADSRDLIATNDNGYLITVIAIHNIQTIQQAIIG